MSKEACLLHTQASDTARTAFIEFHERFEKSSCAVVVEMRDESLGLWGSILTTSMRIVSSSALSEDLCIGLAGEHIHAVGRTLVK